MSAELEAGVIPRFNSGRQQPALAAPVLLRPDDPLTVWVIAVSWVGWIRSSDKKAPSQGGLHRAVDMSASAFRFRTTTAFGGLRYEGFMTQPRQTAHNASANEGKVLASIDGAGHPDNRKINPGVTKADMEGAWR